MIKLTHCHLLVIMVILEKDYLPCYKVTVHRGPIIGVLVGEEAKQVVSMEGGDWILLVYG